MNSQAIQIRDIQTSTTSLPAVADQMTCASLSGPALEMPRGVAGPECLAAANPYPGCLGSHFDGVA